LEVADLRKVCSTATGEMRRLYAIALFTGMRLGDCATLKEDIRQGRVCKLTAKTHKEVSFPVHPELTAVLNEVPEQDRTGYICPALAIAAGAPFSKPVDPAARP